MKKTNKKRKIWFLVGGILILLTLINIGATAYFYEIAAIRNNTIAGEIKKTSPNYPLVQKFDKLSKTTKELTNKGLKLNAWYIPADKKTNKTVIVVHGFRSTKGTMKQYGELFHELGYNVLMPDNRGHGDSQGQFITYGYYDKQDIISWANLLTKENPESNITLFGLSMGAATVMMASGEENLPSSVKNIIEDCGYSSVWEELTYQAWATYKVPAFPLVYSVSLENKIRQGWFFQEADTRKALAKDKLPILLIHGGTDTYVPTEMIYDNYKAVPDNVPKEMVIVKGAEHAKSFETNPKLYQQKIDDFMKKYNPST